MKDVVNRLLLVYARQTEKYKKGAGGVPDTIKVRRHDLIQVLGWLRNQDLPDTRPEAPFVCPKCRMPSWNLHDKEHGYCGACKAFTGRPNDSA